MASQPRILADWSLKSLDAWASVVGHGYTLPGIAGVPPASCGPDPGEAAAISLAAELGAALLIDELDGRREAQARGLTVIGAVGILERAADVGLIPDLAAVHTRIRGLRFHIADAILQASLARHLARRATQAKGTP
jgi:hypothetical protein